MYCTKTFRVYKNMFYIFSSSYFTINQVTLVNMFFVMRETRHPQAIFKTFNFYSVSIFLLRYC